MQHDYWHNKWEKGDIGFHLADANPLFVAHFSKLNLKEGNTVFVPLCGKTIDIHWLLDKGIEVIGAELNESAIQQLFEELDQTPTIENKNNKLVYCAEGIKIIVGDIFELTAEDLGSINAIYDRAAFVALPEDMRRNYSKLLINITQKAPQLLIGFDYDQSLIPGPPFSTPYSMVLDFYNNEYKINLLETAKIEGGLKGKVEANELVWLLN